MTLLQPDRDSCRPGRTDRGALAGRGIALLAGLEPVSNPVLRR